MENIPEDSLVHRGELIVDFLGEVHAFSHHVPHGEFNLRATDPRNRGARGALSRVPLNKQNKHENKSKQTAKKLK